MPEFLRPRRLLVAGQLLLTLALVAFMVVPVVMSVMAGLTVNYFRGVSSGLTLNGSSRCGRCIRVRSGYR